MNDQVTVPDYIINYLMDPNKLYLMYLALRNKGFNHTISFITAWQSNKELPKGWFAFGNSMSDLDSWTNQVTKSLTSGRYKDAKDIKSYNEYAKIAYQYNTELPNYWTEWLPAGMNLAETYIKNRVKLDERKRSEELKKRMLPYRPDTSQPIDNLRVNTILLPIQENGGIMNYFDYLKAGSKIHIKKANKGKFTDYCGGKVTEECIEKGKHSPSATIRKRANFAANARKWKH